MDIKYKFRLSSIEFLRGLASSAVVLYHVAKHIEKSYIGRGNLEIFQFFHAGVDLFFVISGFIIMYVHYGDIGIRSQIWRYFSRRVCRVIPMYWIATALTIMTFVFSNRPMLPWIQVIVSSTLMPSFVDPVLGVAWTLQFEAVFYVMFATLILSKRLGILTFSAWAIVLTYSMLRGATWDFPSSLFGSYAIEFYFGMSTALSIIHFPRSGRSWMISASVFLIIVFGIMENTGSLDGYSISARFAYGIPSALLIYSLASVEIQGRLRIPVWLVRFGGASYSTYLFQFLFIGILWQLWTALGLDRYFEIWVCFCLLAMGALIGGFLVGRLVEAPIARFLGGRNRSPRPLTV